MVNPYPKIPHDRGNDPMQAYPPATPAVFVNGTTPPAASSVITFTDNTTAIEITALNNSLAFKWGPDSVIAAAGSTANFDHIVPVNTTRRFAIPQSVIGNSTSIVGSNPRYGLYKNMAVIATASVLTGITQY